MLRDFESKVIIVYGTGSVRTTGLAAVAVRYLSHWAQRVILLELLKLEFDECELDVRPEQELVFGEAHEDLIQMFG